MFVRRFVLAVSVSTVVIFPASAQFAGSLSQETQRFIAVARTSANFIDEAGRTALVNGGGKPAKTFARDAIVEQGDATTRIGSFADVLPKLGSGRSVSPPGSDLFTTLFGTFDTAKPTEAPALDSPLATTNAGMPVTANQLAKLDAMQALNGRAFDRAYLASQRETYRTLLTAYQTYAASGDDATLRDLAAQEVPALKTQLDRLGRR